jgi:transcriptional regulator with XRE-family HTH domain
MDQEVGPRLQILRKRIGLSIRQLAERANVTPGIISCIERGKNSPSILTLQKILESVGANLGDFFANGSARELGPVFLREHMQVISDNERHYTIIFARNRELAVEMLDEQICPTDTPSEMEVLKCDVGGYILSGTLELEVQGEETTVLRPGDAFYIPKGKAHHGRAFGAEPVRAITVCCPPNY